MIIPVALFSLGLFVFLRFWKRPDRGQDSSQRRLILPEARIAEDLGPLLKAHITPESCIWVTGGDGFPVVHEPYPWIKLLQDWSRQGTRVRYLLTNPDALDGKVGLSLEPVAHLEVRKVDASRLRDWDLEERALLERMKRFHFLLVDQPKVIWIETDHPPGVTRARHCEFVPPALAEHDPRYATYSAVFRRIWSNYSVPLSGVDSVAST